MAFGTRKPEAMVDGFGCSPANRSPAAKAVTIGQQPAACTATILGRFEEIHPSCSISLKAFHMPINPVPPPVGYKMTSGSCQFSCSAISYPKVFFPSTRYGSFRVDRSNQPSVALRLATSRAQSVINPSTNVTLGSDCRAFDDVGSGSVFWHEQMRLHSRASCVRGQCAGGVSGRWNGQCLDSEMSGHAHGDTHSAGFEGSSRVLRFIFYPDISAGRFLRQNDALARAESTLLQESPVLLPEVTAKFRDISKERARVRQDLLSSESLRPPGDHTPPEVGARIPRKPSGVEISGRISRRAANEFGQKHRRKWSSIWTVQR